MLVLMGYHAVPAIESFYVVLGSFDTGVLSFVQGLLGERLASTFPSHGNYLLYATLHVWLEGQFLPPSSGT